MGRSILVVDDDTVFRNRLAQAFEHRDYQSIQAGTISEARRCFADQPDFAVIDLCLPDGTGLSLVQDAMRLAPSCKTVVLTGFGTITTAVEAIKSGAVNYLTKPVNADEILAALQSMGGQPSPSRALPLPTLEQQEWAHIQRVIDQCEGNVSKAAKVLGLHRRSLQRKLAKRPNKLQ